MTTWNDAKKDIEKHEDSQRPFRLWHPDGSGGEFMRWRNYSHLKNAHLGALIECRWAEVGTTIEVIDIRTQKHWGSYTRRLEEIRFIGGDHIPEKLA